MRVRLKGINSVTKRLADGSLNTYYYAWKGGPRLEGDPGSPEFIASYHSAASAKKKGPAGVLLALLQGYQSSSEFTGLRDRTRSDYVKQIKLIEVAFGDFPLAALGARGTRALFKNWRDELAKRSRRQADYAWTVLARVLSWSKDRGDTSDTPCERGGRLYHGSRAEHVWTDADEEAFYRVAPRHLHLAVLLALWTGQRQGDLLRLTWSAYDGKTIRLKQPTSACGAPLWVKMLTRVTPDACSRRIPRTPPMLFSWQSKTGVRVEIPIGQPLKEALDATPRRSPIILLTMDGTPWTPDGFRASFLKAKNKAGITHVTFNDLRGTAVTRLAIAGATVAQIATITGHSLSDVSRSILDHNYLSRDPALGKSAIAKLEGRTKSPN